MKKAILGLTLISAMGLIAGNAIHIYKTDGSIVDYEESDLDSIVFDKAITPADTTTTDTTPTDTTPTTPVDTTTPTTTSSSIIEGTVTSLGNVNILTCGGWFESGFMTWSATASADGYNVYYKSASASVYTQIDGMLIREYGSYYRADVVGLPAGSYDLKVVPTSGGTEFGNGTVTRISCKAYSRQGFAFLKGSTTGGTGVGAYKDDGSLKDSAIVLYITENTKSSVTLDVITTAKGGTTACTGISAIASALQKGYETRPIDIRLIGKITITGMNESGDTNNLHFKASNDSRPVKNITVEGIGEDATCYGFGIRCIRVQNFEIRNLAVMEFGDDGLAFETANCNIWLHNNDIFYGAAGSDADQVKGDGSIDLKNDSKYMTISYNHFFDSGKMSLCGMKSETGPNYISYDHNWFDHSDSRHPRIRTMSVHVWNNYYDGNSKYGVGVTSGASAFVEANYYRNVNKPMMISMQGTDATGDGTFSSEDGGVIKAYNNVFAEKSSSFSYITWATSNTSFDAYEVSTKSDTLPSTVVALQGGTDYDNFDTKSDLMYSYSPDAPADIPSIVTGAAGRLNGGDFKWEFEDGTDDASYAVNTALQAAVVAYQTKLVKVLGE